MVVIDGDVFVYFKSEIGKIKVCDLHLERLYQDCCWECAFPLAVHICTFLPQVTFPTACLNTLKIRESSGRGVRFPATWDITL